MILWFTDMASTLLYSIYIFSNLFVSHRYIATREELEIVQRANGHISEVDLYTDRQRDIHTRS